MTSPLAEALGQSAGREVLIGLCLSHNTCAPRCVLRTWIETLSKYRVLVCFYKLEVNLAFGHGSSPKVLVNNI